jgi:hypothetical protein
MSIVQYSAACQIHSGVASGGAPARQEIRGWPPGDPGIFVLLEMDCLTEKNCSTVCILGNGMIARPARKHEILSIIQLIPSPVK